MIPDPRRLSAGQNVVPLHASTTQWAFDVYDIATQTMSSNYVEVTGGRGEYISTPFRCVWPAELANGATDARSTSAHAPGEVDPE